ncbi:MAG: hypothetical protein ACFFCE_06120 [Promethearchaeota archaeon]
MDLSSIYSELRELLSLSDKNFNLEKDINQYCKTESDEYKLEILGDILNFVTKFSLFKEIKPFMNSLYICISNTLEIKPDSIFDFEDLLIRNSIIHFVQEYINYSKITQKDQVLKFLSDSFEKLKIEPLIMNLGLLLKPIYQDLSYLSNLQNLKEEIVTYNYSDDVEIQIKQEIDTWLSKKHISFDTQDDLKEQLTQEFKKMVTKYNLALEPEKLKKLKLEIMEMFTMKLTMISLMEQIPDDSFEPIPIKYNLINP